MSYSNTHFLQLFVIFVSQVNGSTLYHHYFVGEDAQLQWTLSTPVQDPTVELVYVKNSAGVNMFYARGTVFEAFGDYSNRVVYNGDTQKSNMNFTLKNVAKSDAGAYTANYDTKDHRGATLVIYVKPSPASISFSVPVVGTDLFLSCTSQSNSVPADHDLVMTYTWFLNGADLSDDDRFVAANQQLTFKDIQRSDKGSKITCKAQETPTLPSDSSPQYTIDPEYRPLNITLNATKSSYRLLKGKTFGPLACSATCEPSCSYQWSHNGNNISPASGVLFIPSIQRVQNGTYTCTASNKHGTKAVSVSLVVEFGPVNIALMPNTTAYRPLHGTGLGPITCSAECEPACSYQWSLGGNNITRDSKILSIPSIQRGQTGTYTCTGSNEHGTKTVSFTVVVESGPFKLTLNTTKTSYRLLKGRTLGPFACSATCEPSCSYQWSHNGNNISPASGVLFIPSIQRVQNGTYTCTATNKHGTKVVSVSVVVELSPMIIHFDSRPDGPDVDENKTVNFVCETEGYPVPTVTIYFERNSTVFKQDRNLSTTLILKNINCILTGYYFCNAVNEVGNVTSKLLLNVLCPPRLDHRKKIEIDHRIGNGENLNITGSFIANPPPTFTWRFRKNDSQVDRVLKNGTESFYYINQQNDYISYGSRVIGTVTGDEHYGQYILEANNTIGSATLVQTVFPRLPPDPAIGIVAVCTSINTAEVVWISKYNGGANQHFRIGVKTSNNAMYTTREKIVDPGENKIVRGLVYGLKDHTGYIFTVYAENKYGKSLLSKTLECVTPGKVSCQAGASTTSIILIVLSTVLITGFVIGIAIRWFFIRRNKTLNDRQKRSKRGALKEQKELDSLNAYQDLGEREQSVDKPYQALQESKAGSATKCKINIYQDLGEREIVTDKQYQQLETTKSGTKQDSKQGNIYDALGQENSPNVYEEIKSHGK